MFELNEYTPFAKGAKKIFKKIDESLPDLGQPIQTFIAGGVAVHLWTAYRVSIDVDTMFSHNIHIPQDLNVFYLDENHESQIIQFDYTYSPTFGLLHPDFKERTVPLAEKSCRNIQLNVLSPVDLAITKLSRFAEKDQEDIQRLINFDLLGDPDSFEELVEDALSYYIGDDTMIKFNIDDVLTWMSKDATLGPQ
ncbi:MAG: DUF6036 family nucleotidyltransferase [Desulfobacteraceae bacterium]